MYLKILAIRYIPLTPCINYSLYKFSVTYICIK
nr:MAG TPA: hypothetical protein [Caudoviricetes sp.]